MLTFIYVWCIIILVRNKKAKHKTRMKEKTKMRRTTTLEKEYGVKIVKDWKNGTKQFYKMYTADGCLWENGLTLKGLNEECEKCGDKLKSIK